MAYRQQSASASCSLCTVSMREGYKGCWVYVSPAVGAYQFCIFKYLWVLWQAGIPPAGRSLVGAAAAAVGVGVGGV